MGAYDNPAALNTQLQEYLDMPYNDYQYLLSTLYSVYSLPNTVLPFLFGSLVDRFGPRRVLLGLSSCVCVGQTVFSIGVQSRKIWMMLVGRAIFGIGGESCGVVQASITTMHFRGYELAFALGLNLCIARFGMWAFAIGIEASAKGSVVNTLVTPWAEQRWNVPTAIWIGALTCVASFIAAVILASMIRAPSTRSASSDVNENTALLTPLLPSVSGTTSSGTNNTLYRTDSITSCFGPSLSASPLIASPTQSSIIQQLPGILRREVSFTGSVHSVRFTPGYAKAGTRPSLHVITDESTLRQDEVSCWSTWWHDLKQFPLTFWLICALTILLYGTVVPFNNIASDFLQSKWYPGNPRKAAAVMGIPDTVGAILVPVFGMLVDRYGGRASTLIGSAFIMVLVHSTLGFTSLSPIFAFSLLGIAYSMYGVALWPSIACVITNELSLGKAYGISSSALNISLTVVPPIVATIRVLGDSFLPVELFFISMGLYGIFVGFILKRLDLQNGGALERAEIEVEVPVLVPQAALVTSTSLSSSIAPSPSLSFSQGGPKKRERPILSCIQSSRPETGLGLIGVVTESEPPQLPKRWRSHPNLDNDDKSDKDGDDDERTAASNNSEGDSCPAFSRTASPPMRGRRPLIWPVSPMTERSRRKWFGARRNKPLLQRTLARVGSPLLQQQQQQQQHQYSSANSGYGSFSSPSLASAAVIMGDHVPHRVADDIESKLLPVSGTVIEDYSSAASRHPILYIPLRGSSGSFKISRSARPIAFGEGEEGLLYINGQEVGASGGVYDIIPSLSGDDDGNEDEQDTVTGHESQVTGLNDMNETGDDTEDATLASLHHGDPQDAGVDTNT
ncbi:hypothetical protein BGX28_001267 [Mortierella sp. GBA30]|nr:hypothetical protein BGX28_001267 [Mortierella sp. GBA30]